MPVPLPSNIKIEASRWSELPEAVKKYEALIDQEGDGISRIFGYASLIKNHANEKPAASHSLPNEQARLRGMEVAMNVYAAGEYEFRGTRGVFQDAAGKERKFANVGVYAGLEPAMSPEGYADGMNITAGKDDRRASMIAYIERELGKAPNGIDLKTLFDENAAAKFTALKGDPKDEFGMYKFQVADVEIERGGKKINVPAITVSTNEESKFAAIGLTPMQTAQMILDGQGYRRKSGNNMVGGAALDYFKQSVMGVARELKLRHPRLEAIDAAVDELAQVYSEAHNIIERKLPPDQEYEEFKRLIEAHPDITGDASKKGIFSPYFLKGQNVNERSPVTAEDQASPQNQMPHTAEEKFRRIEKLKTASHTQRIP